MIHLDPERIARVKRSRDLNTPEWARLVDICEQYLSLPLPYGGHEQNYALAGLISGDHRFKNKAIRLALNRCARGYAELNTHGYGNWGGVRVVLPAVACVYDWLYDTLLPSQRDTLATWIVNFGRLCWTETQPPDKVNTWARIPAHPGDNFWGGFYYGSTIAGLALTANSPPWSAPILALARDKWINQALPHHTQYEPELIPLEGASYGVQNLTNKLLAMDAEYTMGGGQVWPGAPRLIDQYLRLMTTSDMTRLTPWGDNAVWTAGKGVTLMPLNDFVKVLAWIAQNHVPVTGSPTSFAWWLANINPMPPGGWYSNGVPGLGLMSGMPPHLQLPPGVHEHEGYVPDPPSAFGARLPEAGPSPFHWMAWMPLLFARPELREAEREAEKSLVSVGNGFAIASQTPTTRDATQVSFICGPIVETHQPKAPGAVLFYKGGEYLIGNAALWGQVAELGRGAEHHSTLLLPPFNVSEPAWQDSQQSQALKDAQASVKITRYEETNGVLYWEGSLAGAYSYRNPVWMDDPAKRALHPLRKWIRRILWHRARDLFVIIDEVEKESWAPQPVIAWQVREFPNVFADGWRCDVDSYRVQGYTLSPGDVTTATRVGNSWRVEVKPSGIAPSVTALRVTRAGEPFAPAILYTQSGKLGATFGTGPEAVTLAVQMGEVPPPVRRRVYEVTRRDMLKLATEDDLIQVVRTEVRSMKLPDELRIKSYLEPAPPGAEGEVFTVGQS